MPSMMRGVLFLHDDLLGFAEVVQRRLLERQADFIGDHHAAGQDGDVLQHGLAAVAEARRLDGRDLDDAADRVHDQRRERLTLDVFGDDQQRTAGLRDALEQRQHFAHVGDLLLVQKNERVLQLGGLVLLVVDEIRREIAAVELHALDHFELVLQARAFLDRDHAFLADLLHRVGDRLADRLVGVRGDRADLRNRLLVLAGLRQALQLIDGRVDGGVDAALQVHRVGAGGDGLQAFAHDRLGEHGGGGGAVAGLVGGVGSDFLHHLRAHVLELVLQLDFLRDRHAVLGDGGGAEALLEHRVAALGAQRRLYGVRQDVDASEHPGAGVVTETYFFSCHVSQTSE